MVKRVIADIVYSGPVRGYAHKSLPFGARRLASYHRFSGFFDKTLGVGVSTIFASRFVRSSSFVS